MARRKNDALGLFVKVATNIAKETNKQYQKKQKEALRQQKEYEKLQNRIRKEEERKQKRQQKEYERKKILEAKEQSQQEAQKRIDKMNTKIYSLLSYENKEEIKHIKSDVSQFYEKWNDKITSI